MRLEQTPKPEHTLRVSTRLITSSTILHLSADELERTLIQEQIENPALEVDEKTICFFCSSQLYGTTCPACGHSIQDALRSPDPPQLEMSNIPQPTNAWEPQFFYDIDTYGFVDIDNYGFSDNNVDEVYDPLANVSHEETLAEELLQQLETLITPEDEAIAEQLVGNLNERGYLEISTEEIAALLHIQVERVEYVLSQLQKLEPLGIGARDLRECLQIQLQAISEQCPPPALTAPLIDLYLEQLGHNQLGEIARRLKVTEQEIRQASQYIRKVLHPYPGHIHRADVISTSLDNSTTYIRPDVIIRPGESGFEVRLIEEERYNIHIETTYTGETALTTFPITRDVQRYMYQHRDRARFFVDCIQRRWRTLKRVMEMVVGIQTGFLEKGVRDLLPLTRAQVANKLHLDEGTVSRATANKYALLPNGRLISIADFFDGTLGTKDRLRELIRSEDPKHRLSDEDLARQLSAQGKPLARRTITKYREEMGIASSRERG